MARAKVDRTIGGHKVTVGQMPVGQALDLRMEIIAVAASAGSLVTVPGPLWGMAPMGDLASGLLAAVRYLDKSKRELLVNGLLTNVLWDGKPLADNLDLLDDLEDLDQVLLFSLEVNFKRSFTAIVAAGKALAAAKASETSTTSARTSGAG